MTKNLWRLTLNGALLVTLTASPADAQNSEKWFDAYRTFSLYVENDALAKWAKDTSDRSFTQGLRLTWEFAKWPDWAAKAQHRLTFLGDSFDACTPQRERISGPCGTVQFGLGQTMYSPDDIITRDLQPQDQPFAGWLFATAGFSARHNAVQSTTEFVVGVVGPVSVAEDTQSFAHWTWATGAPRPAGWDHQLRNSLHVGATQTYGWHFWEHCVADDGDCRGGVNEGRRFDASLRSEMVATTLMRRGSLGLTVRAGKNFPDAMAVRIPATGNGAADTRWWVVFASADGRGVLHNGFIEGTYADDGPDGWRAVRQIEARRWINELSCGFGGGNNAFGVFVQAVSRSLEWDPVGLTNDRSRHNYLSFSVSLNHGR